MCNYKISNYLETRSHGIQVENEPGTFRSRVAPSVIWACFGLEYIFLKLNLWLAEFFGLLFLPTSHKAWSPLILIVYSENYLLQGWKILVWANSSKPVLSNDSFLGLITKSHEILFSEAFLFLPLMCCLTTWSNKIATDLSRITGSFCKSFF